MSSFYNATKVQRIIRIVERLRVRSSNRLTVNVIRNQQRNRRTLDETNIASPQAMGYDSPQLVGLRRSFARLLDYDFERSGNLCLAQVFSAKIMWLEKSEFSRI
jgi:hypothetical protein